MDDWVKIVVSILSGIAVCIPVVIKLIQYVTKSVKAKNWPDLMEFISKLVIEAEPMFSKGADRKAWVLAMVKASADELNYDVDMDIVGSMIDTLCDVSKKVNVTATTTK